MSNKILVYNRFNRFWHWSQALLIALLGVTGFEIHGTFRLLGFERAVALHNWLALAFGVLVAFAIFWHLTTGQWRQYSPTRRHLREMVHFYLRGIFRGEHHPFKKTEVSKLNPLQRLAYLGLKVLVIPSQVLSGFAYFYYNDLAARNLLPGGVGPVALIHSAGTFALLVFLVVHIYLTTTGETPTAHLKAMITGWETLPEAPPAESPPSAAIAERQGAG